MTSLFSLMTPTEFALAFAVALIAGTVKGMVGFALPMLLISGLNIFLPAEIALAGLILPTLVTNTVQALPQGVAMAWRSMVRFRVFLCVGVVCLLASAQLVRVVPGSTLFLMIGVPVTVFAGLQLAGVELRLRNASLKVEVIAASIAGFIGGFSGVWGPPTVAYLTALDTPKQEQMRIQGVIYGLGSLALLFAHAGSGIMNERTLSFSLALVVPAMLGMVVGRRLHDRVDQATFRKATLAVLTIAGLNLIRRGLVG